MRQGWRHWTPTQYLNISGLLKGTKGCLFSHTLLEKENLIKLINTCKNIGNNTQEGLCKKLG